MFSNRMSLQMFKQLFDRIFTNSFPVQGMPDDLGGALDLAERGEIELNPPVEPNQVEKRFRGRVAYDKAKCIGCKMCIRVCPANAIEFVAEEKKVKVYSDRCCFCGQCTEVCPVNCLAMSDEFLFSSYDRKTVVVTDSGSFSVKTDNVVKSFIEEEPEAEEAVKGAVSEKPKYEIDQEKCIGCTKCTRVCPVDAITGEPKKPHFIDRNTCVGCGQCAENCPVEAIHVEGAAPEKKATSESEDAQKEEPGPADAEKQEEKKTEKAEEKTQAGSKSSKTSPKASSATRKSSSSSSTKSKSASKNSTAKKSTKSTKSSSSKKGSASSKKSSATKKDTDEK